MRQQEFQETIEKYAPLISQVKEAAHQLHNSVNQTYAVFLPYGYHLDMVANSVLRFGHEVCVCAEDILPVVFGAYYHDSIEDARLTYNDVTKAASQFMNAQQAFISAEIVYALTNEKGRTRAERAGEKYYAGIRETPYAPFVKLADRLANVTYSCEHSDALNARMKGIYASELTHFLAAIQSPKAETDRRFALPLEMVEAVHALLG